MRPLLSKEDIERQIAQIKAEDAERKADEARFCMWLANQPEDIKALGAFAQREVFALMERAGDGLSR
jgi:hypothetical protein